MTFCRSLVLLAIIPGAASAAHWNVDHAKSHLGFAVKWSGEPFVATFKTWNADIHLDPDDLTHAHIVAAIDLASEVSDSPENDTSLKGSEGLFVSQYPAARFVSSNIVRRDATSYVANGTLALHGFTRVLDLPFTLTITGNRARAEGKSVVSRLDFGIGMGEWAASQPIDHAVIIDVELEAVRVP